MNRLFEALFLLVIFQHTACAPIERCPVKTERTNTQRGDPYEILTSHDSYVYITKVTAWFDDASIIFFDILNQVTFELEDG